MALGAKKSFGEGQAPRKVKNPLFNKRIFLISIILLTVALVFLWKVAGSTETLPLLMGELENIHQVEGVLIRDETVIISPATGELTLTVGEGERVRGGQKIAEVKTLTGGENGFSDITADITAPRSGVVISKVDGLEGILSEEQVNILEVADKKFDAKAIEKANNIKSQKGQPIIKVVDSLAPVTVCLQIPENFSQAKLEKGKSITFVWDNKYFSGIIDDIRINQNDPQVLLKVSNYPEAFYSIRRAQLGLLDNRISGFIVPVSSLVEKDGRVGLKLVKKHQQKWVPVVIEGVVNGQAAVSGEDLAAGSYFVVEPAGFPIKI